MSSIADRRRALQEAEVANRAVGTRATRQAVTAAQEALRRSPEAARARRQLAAVRLSPS